MCHLFSSLVEPDLVVLNTSRGYETPSSKLFMRSTVLLCDLLLFFPAVLVFISFLCKDNNGIFNLFIAVSVVLLQPAFVLIDHGHFQYNCVALGLSLWGFYLITSRPRVRVLKATGGWLHLSPLLPDTRIFLGSFCFVAAIAFKQMSLYYAPAFFFFLLGLARDQEEERTTQSFRKRWIVWFISLATFTLASLALWFLPFGLLAGTQGVKQVLHRVFPVARGLFEDKVASFWCVTSVLFKWKHLSLRTLLPLSTGLTTLSFLPAGLVVHRYPTTKNFLLYCIITSLSFFLFSFHVHEKTILFPLLPVVLVVAPTNPVLALWAGIISTFSLFPLLVR